MSFSFRLWRACWLLSLTLLLLPSLSVGQTDTPPQSTFFSTAAEEAYSTYQMPGDGDLWPSCWSDDDNLYAANGDGTAFTESSSMYDMAVSKISGMPPDLTGTTVATNVGTNWAGKSYNRKPTGMLCTDGAIYLAFQNLNRKNFDDAPAASIAKSTDRGATWTWDAIAPMFGTPGNASSPIAYKFTTVFFLDYGKDSEHAIDGFVYAYGLDNNWRSQQKLYLARVPGNSIQTRSAWQFYSGSDGNGAPMWSNDITQKAAVLTDKRLLYPSTLAKADLANQSVVAQGGVVYDQPFHRYIFASWSWSTHQLYEAPQPWGPWSHVLSNDFGPLRLTHNRGMYGTSIPSKFISADGKNMYLQSNVCCRGDSYTFSLRKLYFETYTPASPTNIRSNANLALAAGARAISKSTHFGSLCGFDCSDQLNNGDLSKSEDDFDEESKTSDWWGYTWPRLYRISQIVYETGNMSQDGGWYASNLRVQVRRNFQWLDVNGVTAVTPAYPYSRQASAHTAYTFNFPETWGDGVRIIGTPGGSSHFSSISQLGVYYGGSNLMGDPGFELQNNSTLSSPWSTEGPDGHGVERGGGLAHSGANDAWIRNSTSNWDAVTQTITVQPNTNYTLTGWLESNLTTNVGYFGVRASDGATVLRETPFGSDLSYTPLTVTFNSGSNSTVTVFAGFHGQSMDRWIRVDDLALR